MKRPPKRERGLLQPPLPLIQSAQGKTRNAFPQTHGELSLLVRGPVGEDVWIHWASESRRLLSEFWVSNDLRHLEAMCNHIRAMRHVAFEGERQ